MSSKFVAISGAISLALGLVACSGNGGRPDNEWCAMDGDGALVSTVDGKNFTHLNDKMGDEIPDAAFWVEGEAGWGGGPICTSRDGEFSMPRKDFPHGGKVKPHEPEFNM
jgi:hypothetical protein